MRFEPPGFIGGFIAAMPSRLVACKRREKLVTSECFGDHQALSDALDVDTMSGYGLP
jgi:hypothetical protein